MPSEKGSIPDDAVKALESGNKIEAIKIVRSAYRSELKEAKELVETFLQENAGLHQRYTALQSENRRTWKLILFIIVFVTVLILFFFGNR